MTRRPRNKYIFDAVANHFDTYGCHTRWNYFESGHGKGPCDGLGGTSKRMADEGSRSERCVISDARDFYQWGKTTNMTNISFRFVSKDTCEAKANLMASRSVKSVAGTMKLHSVVGLRKSKIMHRITSCFCSRCLVGEMCSLWSPASTYEAANCSGTSTKDVVRNSTDDKGNTTHDNDNNIDESLVKTCIESSDNADVEPVKYKKGDYVAAVYHDEWYIGKLVDCDDSEVEIDFMQQKKQLLQWPTHKDQIWIKKVDVLCTMLPPNPTDKSGRTVEV